MATKRIRTQQDDQFLYTILDMFQCDRHKQMDPYVDDPSLVDQVQNMKRLRDIAHLVFSYLHIAVDIVPLIIREIKKLANRTIETTSQYATEKTPPSHTVTATPRTRKRHTPQRSFSVKISKSLLPYVKDPSLINQIVDIEELRGKVRDAIVRVRAMRDIIQIGKEYAKHVKKTTHKFSRTV